MISINWQFTPIPRTIRQLKCYRLPCLLSAETPMISAPVGGMCSRSSRVCQVNEDLAVKLTVYIVYANPTIYSVGIPLYIYLARGYVERTVVIV